ncbi:unnamed protein product [Prorocentrum cordatum]|uniref:Mannosyltransferase n=1 Tax=Prorocentrum cordatum TaxID=2364126 RepID=A0ABN9XR41_9DINO|nr:unnamed protein product [Polarella glacialis]
MKEVNVTAMFVHALCSVPRESSTKLAKYTDGKFAFQSISSAGLYSIMLLVVVPRLAIAFFLLNAGLLFLCHTVNLQQLLFNSLALGFVLDIDEMIYPIFVPSRVQRVASRMRPFTLEEYTKFAPGSAVATAALGVVQRLPIRL